MDDVVGEEKKKQRKKLRANVARKLALFPIIYVVLSMPVVVDAALRYYSVLISPELSMVSRTLFVYVSLHGLVISYLLR